MFGKVPIKPLFLVIISDGRIGLLCLDPPYVESRPMPGEPYCNQSSAIVLKTELTSSTSNEALLAWLQFSSRSDAEFPLSKTIPAMTIVGLGIVGANPQGSSTSIGFPPTLPGFREHDTYQITDAFSYVTESHSMKFGVELL